MKIATSLQVVQQGSKNDIGEREDRDADRHHRVIIIKVGKDPSHRAGGRRG